MFEIDENWLRNHGVTATDPQELQRLVDKANDELEARVSTTVLAILSDQEFSEYETTIQGGTQNGAVAWLNTHLPEYPRIVENHQYTLSQELFGAADKRLLSPSGQVYNRLQLYKCDRYHRYDVGIFIASSVVTAYDRYMAKTYETNYSKSTGRTRGDLDAFRLGVGGTSRRAIRAATSLGRQRPALVDPTRPAGPQPNIWHIDVGGDPQTGAEDTLTSLADRTVPKIGAFAMAHEHVGLGMTPRAPAVTTPDMFPTP